MVRATGAAWGCLGELMKILGLGGSAHDFAACVVVDGEIAVAIEEERLSRKKHHTLSAFSGGWRLQCVDYCLERAGVELGDIDVVAGNDLIHAPILREYGATHVLGHHLSHAACAHFTSGHDRSAILVVDGFGSIDGTSAETVSYFDGSGAELTPLWQSRGRLAMRGNQREFTWRHFDFVADSIGALYSFVSELLAFEAMEEGKMMGLAPYGSDRFVADFRDICPVDQAQGVIRIGREQREALRELITSTLKDVKDDPFATRADFAFAVQQLLEEYLLMHANRLAERTGSTSVALSGGVFLNCLANYRIATETPFSSVHVYGAAGDAGTAIGAALHAYASASKRRPVVPASSIFSGGSYSTAAIADLLDQDHDVSYERLADRTRPVADLLASGAVVGWFQGGAEFGPRALGNRSILADPRRAEMKDVINVKVKRRETFRPFAPAVMSDVQDDYYAFGGASPHMTFAPKTTERYRDVLAAVTHVDSSSRIETVDPDFNPRLYELLRAFHAITGVGALLNTSFNEREPIVETPAEALSCFKRTDMDFLVLEDFLVWKLGSPPPAVAAT